MVHALEQIRNSIVFQGLLIDLRPLAASWPIEVIREEESIQVGRITDLPSGLRIDQAANDAMEYAHHQVWFSQHGTWIFPFYYYWDSLDELIGHVNEKWADFSVIEAGVIKAAKKVIKEKKSNYRVRIRLEMHLSCWQKSSQ
jgi:hypothetical protein